MASTSSRIQSSPGTKLAGYVRIEGIGWWDTSASNSKSVYLFTELPDWTPAATQKFITGLRMPGSFTETVDGMGGISEASSLTFEFDEYLDSDGSNFWAPMFGSSRSLSQSSSSFPWTFLEATISRAATTVTADDATIFTAPGHIFIGNECISYASITDAAPDTFNTCVRGRHPVEGVGAPATGNFNFPYRHRKQASDGVHTASRPYISSIPMTWYNRKIAFYLIHQDQDGTWATESEAYMAWKGRIQSRRWTGSAYQFSCRSIISDLDRKIYAIEHPTTRTTGYHMGADPAYRTLSVRVADTAGAAGEVYPSPESTFPAWRPSLTIDELIDSIVWRSTVPRLTTSFDGADYVLRPDTTAIGDKHFTLQIGNGIKAALGPAQQEPAYSTVTRPLRYAAQSDSAYFRDGSLETVRVEDASGFVTSQGDVAHGYAIARTGDVSYVLWITDSDTASTPNTLEARYVYNQYFEPLPGVNTEGITRRIFSHGPLELTPCFIPNFAAGWGKAWLRILTSTGDGDNDFPGSVNYDVYPVDHGVGLDPNDLDEDSFLAVETYFPEALTNRFFPFIRSLDIKKLLEEEARLMGLIFYETAERKIAVKLAPRSLAQTATPVALDETNKAEQGERATIDESADGIYNVIKVKLDYDPVADQWLSPERTIVDVQSVETFGRQREYKIENEGARSVDGWESIFLPSLVSRQSMFRFPYPRISRSISRRLWSQLNVGDIVTFSDDAMPNPFTGGYGVSGLAAFIESLTTDYGKAGGSVRLRLFPSDRASLITPSAEITSYSSGGGAGPYVLTCAANTFGESAADASFFQAGDKVRIYERDPANVAAAASHGGFEVQSVAGNNITLTTDFAAYSTLIAWFITFDTYDVATASQKSRACWQSDGTQHNILTTLDFYVYS